MKQEYHKSHKRGQLHGVHEFGMKSSLWHVLNQSHREVTSHLSKSERRTGGNCVRIALQGSGGGSQLIRR